jgi:hypothetical protein
MIDYKDPVAPIIRLLKPLIDPVRVYGNTFPSNTILPALLVKTAGGYGYTRIQIIARDNSDIQAMSNCIEASNILIRNAANIQGLRTFWAERETNPIASVDDDTGKQEAWCYIRLEHLEG